MSSQYGISIEMNTDSVGYPIYRMNEIHNMLCDLNVDKYADISHEEYTIFALNSGDVLFNRTNSFEWVGRTGIYYKTDDDDKPVFASYLVRFNTTEETILPEYLCAYLNCKYGVWDIKRRARQSINQTNVNPEEVKEIEIPLLNKDIQSKIKDCFLLANDLRLKAKAAYDDASNYLNLILGLDHLVLAEQSTTQKKFTDIKESWRFDAEYYQPKYEQTVQHIAKYPQGYDTIGNLFFIKDRNYTPIPDKTYQYIELSNIGSDGSITGHTETFGDNLPSRARRIVHSGDIIVSSLEGSLQSCALISDEYDNAICSTGFYVLSPKNINAETALVLFKSQLIQSLMARACSGSIMAAMSTSEFANIKLPKIDDQTQIQIKKTIQESTELKKESVRLLDLAKTAVEVAIEQGENKALELLNSENI